jgi:hypothetical protein
LKGFVVPESTWQFVAGPVEEYPVEMNGWLPADLIARLSADRHRPIGSQSKLNTVAVETGVLIT